MKPEPSDIGSPGSVNPGIQALRGAAALLVVLHHALERAAAWPGGESLPGWWIRVGAAGVDIFFVISGTVIALSAFGRAEPRTAGAFLASRVRRIYPFYWFCTLAVLAWQAGGPSRPAPETVLASLLLLPHEGYVIHVAWTLVFEMYFYLVVFLVLAASLPRRTAILLVPAAILGLMVIGQAAGTGLLADFLADPLALEFLFGFGLALALRGDATRIPWPGMLVVAGGALLLLASWAASGPDVTGLPSSRRFLAWGVPALLVVAGASRLALPAGRTGPLLMRLGDASYAIYLTHLLALAALDRAVGAGLVAASPWLTVPAGLAASVALGLVAHAAVEKPLTRAFGAGARPARLAAQAGGKPGA